MQKSVEGLVYPVSLPLLSSSTCYHDSNEKEDIVSGSKEDIVFNTLAGYGMGSSYEVVSGVITVLW
jgi:hypothetical protein